MPCSRTPIPAPSPAAPQPEPLPLHVVYDDDDLAVVDAGTAARAADQGFRRLIRLADISELAADDRPPPGALGVRLTGERSLAVAPGTIPLGAPVFLATTRPSSAEPLQRLMFHVHGCDRIKYKMDNRHPRGASHHQKLIIVDNSIAFLGGADQFEPSGRRGLASLAGSMLNEGTKTRSGEEL